MLLDVAKNAQDSLYTKSSLKLEDFSPEDESAEYYAHTFTIENRKGLFRVAKKTLTKSGFL